MKEYKAISPSMKDQWSGNTLRRFFFSHLPAPMRSSIHVVVVATARCVVLIRAPKSLVRPVLGILL